MDLLIDRQELARDFHPNIIDYIGALLDHADKFAWLGVDGLQVSSIPGQPQCFQLNLAGIEIDFLIYQNAESFDVKTTKEHFADYLCDQEGDLDILSLWKKEDKNSLVKVVEVLIQLVHNFHLLEFANLCPDKCVSMSPTLETMQQVLAKGGTVVTRMVLWSTQDQGHVAYTGQLNMKEAVDFVRSKVKNYPTTNGEFDVCFEVKTSYKAFSGPRSMSNIAFQGGSGIKFFCGNIKGLKARRMEKGNEAEMLEIARDEVVNDIKLFVNRYRQRKMFVKHLKAALGGSITDVDERYYDCRAVVPALEKCIEEKRIVECPESVSKEDAVMLSPAKAGATKEEPTESEENGAQEAQDPSMTDSLKDCAAKAAPEDHNANLKAMGQNRLIKSCKVVLEVPSFSLERQGVANFSQEQKRRFKIPKMGRQQQVVEQEKMEADVGKAENPADASQSDGAQKEVLQDGCSKIESTIERSGTITMDFDLTELPDQCPTIKMTHQPSGVEQFFEGSSGYGFGYAVEEMNLDTGEGCKGMVNSLVEEFLAIILPSVLKDTARRKPF